MYHLPIRTGVYEQLVSEHRRTYSLPLSFAPLEISGSVPCGRSAKCNVRSTFPQPLGKGPKASHRETSAVTV